jgi:hypothetical protein
VIGGFLLDRHAFGEIARLVDIGALDDRGVVSEELDRDRVEQGRDKRRAIGDRDAEREPVFTGLA